MKILKEDIQGISNFKLDGILDLTNINTQDALVKSIDTCKYNIQSLVVEENMILLRLEVISIITYLDARTLKEIKMNIDFKEEIPFSFDKDHSNEMDIDYFEEELDLKQLIFELIMINIPFNYSEENSENVLKEEEFYKQNNQPFAKIFEEKE
ncbi:MAG: hypothetical protein ACK5HR_06670 [Mycoplasmatales bacterium]